MKVEGGAILLLAAGLAAVAPEAAGAQMTAAAPQRREVVLDLAFVLGEMHALHRLCAGQEDDTWRATMGRLMTVESPDSAYRQRLTAGFNAGFMDSSAAFPSCTLQSQTAERRMAQKGRALSRRLAQSAAF